jgi:hypothetical protein
MIDSTFYRRTHYTQVSVEFYGSKFKNSLAQLRRISPANKNIDVSLPILLVTLKKDPFVLQCETTGSAKEIRDLRVARL